MGLFPLTLRSSTMASIALMVGGAFLNTLAFSGSNYLFSKLDKGDTAEEQKRHDKAMEQLQTARLNGLRSVLNALNGSTKSSGNNTRQSRTSTTPTQHGASTPTLPGKLLPRWSPSPSFPTFIHLVAPKKTARFTLLSWGWPQPAL